MSTWQQPKVSIITATFNSERFLENTILSVINQSYSNIEYLIIDGASKDNTLKIVDKYKEKISVCISEPDQGIYDAFNKGIHLATGDVIYFLNSDDYLCHERIIEEVVTIFAKNPDLSIVYGNIVILDETINHSFIKGKQITLDDLKKGYMPPHPAFFARKELFYRFRGFDQEYKSASDLDFIINCFKYYSNYSFYINKEIAVFRLGGLCSHFKTQQIGLAETRKIIKYHFNLELPEPENNTENLALYKQWVESILLRDEYVSQSLFKQGVKKVAIFGTMRTALYLWADLAKFGIKVVCFIDNNSKMQGMKIRDIEVKSPNWIIDHAIEIDSIIISVEANYDEQIREQLVDLLNGTPKPILTWKELVTMNLTR